MADEKTADTKRAEERIEKDSLGEVPVPLASYWGAQTQRSLKNFAIGDERMPTSIIQAYALIKKAAAQTNVELGVLPGKLGEAISKACDDVLADRLSDQFPLVVWQTGSGTQTNMNVNEVLANRATEILEADFRTEKLVHPNDHVNASQSSNDTFPTAMHIAAYLEINDKLLGALSGLTQALTEKSEQFTDVVKTGRTHLMDATPITLGQEFGGYAAQLTQGLEALESSLPRLGQLALGGTAVGTGLNAPAGFAQEAIQDIARLTSLPFTQAPDLFAAMSAHDALVELSGHLNHLAVSLMHIANQIRLLASGPRTGFAELKLPANEPGSSIMPGKVNPTQCEALTMVCARVMGNHTTVTIAGSHGHLQLNTFKPVIAYSVLQSIRLLADACRSFTTHCVEGIEADRARIAELAERSLMLVTALTPAIGYEKAAQIAKMAHEQNITIRDAARALNIIDESQLDALLDPGAMLGNSGQ